MSTIVFLDSVSERTRRIRRRKDRRTEKIDHEDSHSSFSDKDLSILLTYNTSEKKTDREKHISMMNIPLNLRRNDLQL